jgi:superfamily II DNA or RNA helicase
MDNPDVGPKVFAATDEAATVIKKLAEGEVTPGLLLQRAAELEYRIDAFAYVATNAIVKVMEGTPATSRLLLRHPGGIDPGLSQALLAKRFCSVKVIESVAGRLLHAKIYGIHLPDGSALVIVGSSNATRSGLFDNYEANIAVLVSAKTPRARNPLAAFDELWDLAEDFDPLKHRPEPLLDVESRALFEYQEEAVRSLDPLRRAIHEASADLRPFGTQVPGCMVALPTAAGKTLVATRFILTEVLPKSDGDGFRKVLWLAETHEQIDHAVQSLERDLSSKVGMRPKLVKMDSLMKVPVATLAEAYDVLFSTRRLLASRLGSESRKTIPRFDLVVVDEAHHVHSSNGDYPLIFEKVPHLARLGISATPHRHPVEDDPGLYAYFNPDSKSEAEVRPHFERTLDQLNDVMHRGRPIFAKAVPVEIDTKVDLDLAGVENDDDLRLKRGSTFTQARRVQSISDAFQKEHRPALFFAVDIADANAITKALIERGVKAQSVHTGSPVEGSLLSLAHSMGFEERRQCVEALRSGALEAIVSVDVFIEGVDIPELQSVFIARPTFSPRVYLQMRGRGLRGPATGGTKTCDIVHFRDHVLHETNLKLQNESRALAHERGVENPKTKKSNNSLSSGSPQRIDVAQFLRADRTAQIDVAVQILKGKGELPRDEAIDLVVASLGGATTKRRDELRKAVETALAEAQRRGALLAMRLRNVWHWKVL